MIAVWVTGENKQPHAGVPRREEPKARTPLLACAPLSSRLRVAMASIKGGHLHSIPAEIHAAPTTCVVLGRITEVENTCRILTFFDERPIVVREEIGGRLGDRYQQVNRLIEYQAALHLQPILATS